MIIAGQILNTSHGHRRALILLVVVRFVAHGDFLLTDSPHELALHMTTRRIRRRERFPEDIADVMEEPHSTEENRRVTLPMVQEELRTAVALICGLRQPIFRYGLILSYFFPLEIQLAEDILSVWVSGLSRLRQIIYRLGDILLGGFSLEILFAQTIGRVVAAIFSGGLQPAQALLQITDFYIVGEEQLPKSILRCMMR